MKPLPNTQELIANLHSVVPEALAAWLYGSAASGAMTADSDIDIAVLLPPSDTRKTTWAFLNASQDLAALWGRPVDLVNFRAVSCVLQKEVLSANKRLFCHDELTVANAELHALSQYRDFNERYREEFERISRTGKAYA